MISLQFGQSNAHKAQSAAYSQKRGGDGSKPPTFAGGGSGTGSPNQPPPPPMPAPRPEPVKTGKFYSIA